MQFSYSTDLVEGELSQHTFNIEPPGSWITDKAV